jgi:hypothetical protein
MVTPYVEIERIIATGGADPFYVPDPTAPAISSFDTFETIGGLRIDLSDWTALKLEYRRTESIDRGTVVQEGIANWSWGF